MDGLNYTHAKNREKILFTYEVQCINNNKIFFKFILLLLIHCTSLVWCKCNRQHIWLDIAITNMNVGRVQLYQTCMFVGASLTGMTPV